MGIFDRFKLSLLRYKALMRVAFKNIRGGVTRLFGNTRNVVAIVGGILVGTSMLALLVYVYKPEGPPAKAAVSQIVGVKNVTRSEDPQRVNEDPDKAKPLDILEWQKQVDVAPGDIDATTSAIEKIPDTHAFQPGSVKLPPGWKVQYSDTTATNPTESDYDWKDNESDVTNQITYLKISTDTVTTTKPTSQTALTKPLDQEPLDVPVGMSNPQTATGVIYNNKLFTIFKAVDVSDGVSDSADATINCLDLTTYESCSQAGVTFPTYMSSSADTLLGGKLADGVTDTPKDISTPAILSAILDDGSNGNAGYWYIPVQRGNNYGVNCVDLKNLKNCGFTSYGTSNAPVQNAGENPTLISGFVQNGSKFYGHVNHDNNNADYRDDYVRIICYDMATDAACTGYTNGIETSVPSLYREEHGNSFRVFSNPIIHDNRYYFLMNYDDDNPRANPFFNPNGTDNNVYSQTFFGDRLVCFDLSTNPNQLCGGWPSNSYEVRKASGTIFAPVYYYQTVRGILLTESLTSSVNDLYYRNWQIVKNKDTNGNVVSLCVLRGLGDGGDPSYSCYNPQTAASGTGLPSNYIADAWLNIPWFPGSVMLEDGLKTYSSWSLPEDNIIDGLFGAETGAKSAMQCYDWSIQQFCGEFRKPHYWYEINESNAQDAAYLKDGDCMIGVSELNFAWSFNRTDGETPCRDVNKAIQIKPATDLARAYCDGEDRTASTGWNFFKLNRTNILDYDFVNVTVKDKQGNIVGSFQDVNLKDLQDGKLDIDSINYSGNTNELTFEIDTSNLNTTPWADNPAINVKNYPYATVVMEAEPAQYCYRTQVKPYCDIFSAKTESAIESETEDDLLTDDNSVNVTVVQQPEVQCFRDLKVTVTADKNEVRSGESITYTINVENQANPDDDGRGNVSGATIEGTIPSGFTFVGATGGYSISGSKIRWANESVFAKQTKEKTVTLRANTTTSMNAPSDSNKVYAATTTQPINFDAQAIYDDDYYPADNSLRYSSVLLVSETQDTGGGDTGGGDTGGGDTGGGDTGGGQPVEPIFPEDPVQPGVPAGGSTNDRSEVIDTGTPRYTLTPGILRNVLPPQLGNTVENFFNRVDTAIAPIPPTVAAAVPYSAIAFLIAFALIYVYQAAQEANTRRQMLASYKRFKRTEEMKQSYVDMTSHYLNTPIATMKGTIELLEQTNKVPTLLAESAKQRLQHLQEHTQMLLKKSDTVSQEVTATAQLMDPVAKKPGIFSKGLIVPVLGVLLITLIINALFVWADKYSVNTVTLAVQSSYYVLSVVALVIAYNSFRNQRYATRLAEHELALESQLANSQSTFIASAQRTLESDVIEIDEIAPAVSALPRGSIFNNGFMSLKNAVNKLGYLNILTSHQAKATTSQQNLKEFVDEILTELKPFADKNNVTLNSMVPADLVATIDVDGIKQILYSTLHNAIKFNQPGGTAELSIKRKDKNTVVIVVKDTGRGIAKEKIEQLFKPFGRGTDAETFNFEGFGLDLYMDKLIAEQTGGSMSIASEEGVGTTVTVELKG